MIIIRPLQEKDFKQVLELIKLYQEESINAFNLLCNDEIALAIMPRFLGTSLVMFDNEEMIGVLAGLIMAYPLSNEKVFQEMLWFVKKDYRRFSQRLLLAMENLCKALDIQKMVMAYFGEKNLSRFYNIKGYRFLESHYIKNLT